MKARLFQMRMTSYRNLRFNFHGTYGGAMSAFVGWYFLVILTLGIIFPMWVRRQVAYILGNTAFGTTKFRFVTGNGRFFAFCYATMGLGILVYGAFFVLLFQAGLFNPQNNPDMAPGDLAQLIGLAGLCKLLLIAMAGVSVVGYYQTALANASFGGIEIGPDLRRLQTACLVADLDSGNESAGTRVHARAVLSVGQGSRDALSPGEHVARHRRWAR